MPDQLDQLYAQVPAIACQGLCSDRGDTVTADHLQVSTSDRGFDRLPAILSEYGGSVRVYESSAAMGPHIWLAAEAPANLNEPDGPQVKVPIHLSVENAEKLADQIRFLCMNHYQGGAP